MPNLDESNRIEHHAEKNKMQDRNGSIDYCNRNHVVTQYLSGKIQFRSTASAFSFNFQQSSTVPFKQKTDRTRNIKAPSDRVR